MEPAEAVRAFFEKHPCNGPLFAGFSGGADSTALVLALRMSGIPFTAVHFQHGLRGTEAEADAEWCDAFCRRRQIAFRRENLAVPSRQRPGEGVEEAARRLRLEAWSRLCGDVGCVCLAHHKDDALEELVMRLARGSNVSGLTGLREVRDVRGVRCFRPLLDFRKSELEAWLRGQGIADWRIDGTNADTVYRRNAVRHQVIPLLRSLWQTDGGFCKSLDVLRADADYLEAQAQAIEPSVKTLDAWKALHPALVPRVFRLWFHRQTGLDMPPSERTLNRLALEWKRYDGQSVSFPVEGGWTVCLKNGLMAIEAAEPLPSRWTEENENWRWTIDETFCWKGWRFAVKRMDGVPQNEGTAMAFRECFEKSSLPDVLQLRVWRQGDRMIPFGWTKTKKIQDVFVDAHVPQFKRHAWPMVVAGGTILWLPGIRRAEWGRVCEESTAIVLTAEPPAGWMAENGG